MINSMKRLLLNKPYINMQEDKYEFDKLRLDINIHRAEKIAKGMLILNLILIVIDLVSYKSMRNETPEYLYLYYSHNIVVILICLWFAILKLHRKYSKNSESKLVYQSILNIVMYWCVFMGLNSLNISGNILAYIVGALILSICFYLSPIEGLIVYFVSLVVFDGGLYFLVPDVKKLNSHIINCTISIICLYVYSSVNYFTLEKDFINKKNMLKSRMKLEASNIKLKEYEKMRSDFFANISHELKTPLNVIYSAEQMIEIALKDNECDTTRINRYVKMMKQNSYRLIRLIGNLIDITKIDATSFDIKLINCDVVKTVENIVLSVADYIQNKGIEVIFDTEVEEKIIACDPDKIERIILNLLSNAIKFTEKGGSIFVNLYLKDNQVYISVKDTGIGISNEMKELIFDRFIQVDKSISRNREGSGIGLSLVKSLVQMHSGSITVNSTLGEGSEFIISLPDMVLNSNYEEDCTPSLKEQQIERINIEFSDIYE